MTVYTVKFLHLDERTKDEFEYSCLLDALRVIKETPIDGVTMSHPKFETDLIYLLTSSFMYVGKKSEKYPDGNVMIMLTRRLDIGEPELPVYGPHIVPFVSGTPEMNIIPVQRAGLSSVAESHIIRGED